MDENKNITNASESASLSETFETWTLVADNLPSNNIEKKVLDTTEEIKRVEILSKDAHMKKTHEVATEELSDGISVISESESTEEFNDRFPTISFSNENQESKSEELQQSLTESAPHKKIIPVKNFNEEIGTQFTKAFVVKNVISMAFYVGVAAAILGFTGQLKNLMSNDMLEEVSSLKEKIDNLELNNNLLRAELDILQKKVNYLSNLKEGNDGSNLYRQNKHEQLNKEQLNLRNQKEFQNSNFHEHKLKSDNSQQEEPEITSACHENEKYSNGVCKPIENNNDRFKKDSNKIDTQRPEQAKHFHNENVEKYTKEYSGKYGKYDSRHKHDSGESHEHHHDKNSKNKKFNKYDDDDSKEHFNSKEFNKHYDKSKVYNKHNEKMQKYDSDWHAKMMDSRENFRKQKDKGKDNWYVERAQGREEFRIFEEDEYKKKFKSR